MIAPAEADAFAIEGSDAVVGNSHAVGVAAERAQDLLGSTEWRLGVDVPSLLAQLFDESVELCRVAEGCGRPSEVEQASLLKLAKSGEELLAEDSAQQMNWHEEHRMTGRNPALMICRQSPAGNDAVDMVMRQQVRTPRMQDGEEADLGTEALGIGSDFEQCLRDALKEQIENGPARSQCQGVELVGESADDMKVVRVEQIAPLRFEPSLGGARAWHLGQQRDRHEL